MMKRTYTVLALAALLGAGCVDLTEHPVTGVASDYFTTPAGANAAVIGTYAQLRGIYGGEQEIRTTMVGTDSWEKGGQLLDQSYWNAGGFQCFQSPVSADHQWRTMGCVDIAEQPEAVVDFEIVQAE